MERVSRIIILLTAVMFCYLTTTLHYGIWNAQSTMFNLPSPKQQLLENVYHGPVMEIGIEGPPWTPDERIKIRITNMTNDQKTKNSEVRHLLETKKAARRSGVESLKQYGVHVFAGESPAPEWLKNASSFLLKVPSLRSIYRDAFPSKKYTVFTSASNSYFRIINPKSQYNLCDTIEIEILVKDGKNVTKQYGGDHLFVILSSLDTKSSAIPDGGIQDHMNGSYTARFTLRWTGNLRISVTVMHSSEAVSALRRVSEKFPTRASYDGFFWNGNDVGVSACHITPYFYIKQRENESYVAEMCNFTEPITGAPWYCAKPVNFSCTSYGNHSYSMRDNNILDIFLSKDEKEEIIKRPSEITSIGNARVRVQMPAITDSLQSVALTCASQQLPQCDIKNKPEQNQNIVAGFYHRDNWISLHCNTHIGTNTTFLSNCLRDKTLYFLGDSTLRQWFVYFLEKLGERKIDSALIQSLKMGMDYWKSRTLNIS
ncbi:NXPE family member 3-like [Amphiura filiformis]|uniref:NXPE family member 3-like n=1 Tax=Amphiura filiformis TaxID=82378 RepID=UPI003B21EF53